MGLFWVKLKSLRNHLFNLICSANLFILCEFSHSNLGKKRIEEEKLMIGSCLGKGQEETAVLGNGWWKYSRGDYKVEVVRVLLILISKFAISRIWGSILMWWRAEAPEPGVKPGLTS